jgi:hypothetical protein
MTSAAIDRFIASSAKLHVHALRRVEVGEGTDVDHPGGTPHESTDGRARLASLGQVKPRQLLVLEKVPGGLQSCGIVESADVEVRLGRQDRDFTGQGGTALLAETAHCSRRRRELGDLALRHDVGAVIEPNEHGDRRAAVLSAALAMTPEN